MKWILAVLVLISLAACTQQTVDTAANTPVADSEPINVNVRFEEDHSVVEIVLAAVRRLMSSSISAQERFLASRPDFSHIFLYL